MEIKNLCYAWATLIIHELKVNNITDFVIAPGSRSAPLTIACAEDQDLTKHIHLDERGVGFFALGLAKAKQKPVAVITTSGTAVANLYPAVIESYMTNVPLIILSADRPYELYDSGSNQTINQLDIFNKYAKCVSLAEPNTRIPIKSVLNKIDHAVYTLKSENKPLQLNCPLYKPLYPNEPGIIPEEWLINYLSVMDSTVPQEIINNISSTHKTIPNKLLEPLFKKESKFLFVIGDNVPQKHMDRISKLADALKALVIADLQSSYPYERIICHDLFIKTKSFLNYSSDVTTIIQFGNHLISNKLISYKDSFSGLQITVSNYSDETDPNFNSSMQIIGIDNFLSAFETLLPSIKLLRNCDDTKTLLLKINQKFESHLYDLIKSEESFDELSASLLIAKQTFRTAFIGNSLCCRILDLLKFSKTPSIFTNRGASGIDGIIATACGIAAYYGHCALIIGDISALHDLSSFMLLRKYNVTVIIFNNRGGNIFALLKNHKENPYLDDYFELTHNINFSHIAKMLDIKYQNIETINDFNLILRNNVSVDYESRIIECTFIKDLGVKNLKQIEQELISLY